MALTMVDSMDTMALMGLTKEYDECVEWIKDNLKFDHQKDINLFETTIRVLGGLLGAHTLRPSPALLEKAIELGDAMLFAFDTPTGVPHGTLDLKDQKGHNPSWTSEHSTVAEVGSIQMEFRLLSKRTGNPVYREKVAKPTHWLKEALNERGLFTQFISPITGRLRPGVITLGARVDSVYEYFLKLWVMEGGRDAESRRLWEASIQKILSELTLRSNATGLTFVAEKNGHTLLGKMDHLVCFLPGVMALDYTFRRETKKKILKNNDHSDQTNDEDDNKLTPVNFPNEDDDHHDDHDDDDDHDGDDDDHDHDHHQATSPLSAWCP